MTEKKPMCGECVWLDQGKLCRRFPPVTIGGVWPTVSPYDWCGEYKWREAEKEEIVVSDCIAAGTASPALQEAIDAGRVRVR